MIPAVQNDKSLMEEHKFYQNSEHSLECFQGLFNLDNAFNAVILAVVGLAIYKFVKLVRRRRAAAKERAVEKLSPV
ncbi:hypothetical protein Cantr_06669 [Candida viswanathii]|uniref:Uncharacterized protein n=1 Tax=Candida viswanathii TaxID=5486 RepID=A0A367XUK8_9ASCO|nr:hypothetical protein Cantr_06669 [Candida viswanathii]